MAFLVSCAAPKPGKEAEINRPAVVESHAFELPDGSVKALVSAVPTKIEPSPSEAGMYSVLFQVGSIPAFCIFTTDRDVVGQPAHALIAGTLPLLKEFQSKGPFELETRVVASVIGAARVFSIDVGVKQAEKKGLFQYRIAVKDDHGVVCMRPALDQPLAFDGFFNGLIETLEVRTAGAPPIFREISSLRANTESVGLKVESLIKESDGAFRVEGGASFLIPTSNGAQVPVDETTIERTRADGSVVDVHVVRREGGIPTMDLTIEPSGVHRWHVHGKLRESVIDERFTTTSALHSSIQHRWAVREAAQGRPDRVTIREFAWLPDREIGGLSEIITNLETTESGAVRANARIGTRLINSEIDANGLAHSQRWDDGPMTREVRREAIFGAYPPPSGNRD